MLLPTLVRDSSGHAVYGLQARDFVVEDNGVPQTVHLDEEVEGEPLSVVVAIQTGRSGSREFPRIRGLNSMLGPILDEPRTKIAIVEFDSQVHLVQDFTPDPEQIQNALQSMQPGDGGAEILSVVRYSAELLNKIPGQRRRVLLLISETRDHGSRGVPIDDLISLIGNSNIAIYALAFSPGLGDVIDPYRDKDQVAMSGGIDWIAALALARAAMRRNTPKALASQTGGEYEMFDTLNGFENHMLDFTNHLHSRYVLSFQPKDPPPGLHRITVRLADSKGMTVLARTNYWAGGVGGAASGTAAEPRSPFEGRWQSRINPATEKPAVTLNISLTGGSVGGTVTVVNSDGIKMASAISNPSLDGRTFTFESTFENGARFFWRLTLDKDGSKGKLHGAVAGTTTEEIVFKQPGK